MNDNKQKQKTRQRPSSKNSVDEALLAMADSFLDTLGEIQQLYVVDVIPLYFFYSVGGDIWQYVKEKLPPDMARMLATLALKYPSASERSGRAAREVLRMRRAADEYSPYAVYKTVVRELYPMSFRERVWPQIRVLNARYLSQPLTNARVGRARVLQDQVDYLMRGENDGEMLDELSGSLVEQLKREREAYVPAPQIQQD